MSEKLSFIDIVNKYIQSNKVTLPVFSSAALRIQQELTKKDPEIRVVEKIITADQSLSTQVMKFANSSFYRGISDIKTVRAAIMRLGLKEILQIVLLATSRNHFQGTDKKIKIVMRKLWQHSVGCGYASAWISKRHEYDVEQSHAFFAGLFHDIGMLFILMVIEHIKQRNRKIQLTHNLMLEAMEKLHTSQGFKLLQKWNMPEQFCNVAKDHHKKDYNSHDSLLIIVKMANLVCHKMGIGLYVDDTLLLSATQEASLLNLSEIDLAELEIFLEDAGALTQ